MKKNKISFLNYFIARAEADDDGCPTVIVLMAVFPALIIALMFSASFVFQSLTYLFKLIMEVI